MSSFLFICCLFWLLGDQGAAVAGAERVCGGARCEEASAGHGRDHRQRQGAVPENGRSHP